jgi:hypothetical protein
MPALYFTLSSVGVATVLSSLSFAKLMRSSVYETSKRNYRFRWCRRSREFRVITYWGRKKAVARPLHHSLGFDRPIPSKFSQAVTDQKHLRLRMPVVAPFGMAFLRNKNGAAVEQFLKPVTHPLRICGWSALRVIEC